MNNFNLVRDSLQEKSGASTKNIDFYKSHQSSLYSLYMTKSYINSKTINHIVIYISILKLLVYNNINDNQSRKEARS